MRRDSMEMNLVSSLLGVAILAPNKGTGEHLQTLLQDGGANLIVKTVSAGVEQAGRVCEQESPDLLIVESTRHSEIDLLALEPVVRHYPDMAVVLLSSNQSAEFLRLGMRIGLREILPLPVSRDALIDTIGRIRGKRAGDTPRKAKVLSFIGCKGGSGATFLATNLAYALAAHSRVAMIDLNTQFGDASLYISEHSPACNLSDVARQVHRLDASLLEASMLHVLPTLHVLAAPEDPEQASVIRPEHIDPILWTAAGHYDVVIVDAGRCLDDLTIRAMDISDTVYAVLQLSLPFVRDAKRLLRAMGALGYGKNKVKLLVNRFDKKDVLTLDDVTAALKHDVVRTIPNSFHSVSDSVNQGVPIVKLTARDPVAKALDEMAGELVPVKTQSTSWLKGLLAAR